MLMLLFAVTTWAEVTGLPEMSTDGNIKWYTIKNVRKAKYATYAGESTSMTQQASIQDGSLFYFTGSITDGVATVKIHNAQAGDLLCAGTNSWTAEGIDWYIAAKTTTGLSISKTADFSGTNSWNDFQGSGTSVDYWDATDAGSIWVIEEFGADIKTAIDEMKKSLTTPIFGNYKYDAEKLAALEAAYATFQTNTSIATYNACAEIIATFETIMPEAGKYYVIECPLFERVQGVKKALYSNSDNGLLSWGTEDLSNKAYYWEIYPSGNGYIFKNAADSKFVPQIANDRYTMTEDENSAYAFTFTKLIEAVFNIQGSGTMHCAGHGGGAGSGDRICSWSGDATSASAWTITEVADPDLTVAIANLQNRVNELNNIIAYSGVNPGEYKPAETAKLAEPIANAQEVLDGGSALSSVYNEALATLNSAIATFDLTTNPVTAGKYMIVSAAREFGENTKAFSCYAFNTIYSTHNTPAWAPINENDPLQYWTLEANNDGSFNIKATYEGNYITDATSMSATAGAATFETLGKAQFKILLGGVLHANGWNWGGESGPLTTWENGLDSPSAWKLIAVEEPTFTHSLSVTSAGYATLMLAFDATIPAGVECYTVDSYESDWVNLTQVEGILPAGEAVIVKAAEGTYEFVRTTGGVKNEKNLLEGTLFPKNIAMDAYVLANGANGVGLYKATKNQANNTAFLNNANKIYLPAENSNNAASYSFNFDWNGTTGIEGIEAEGAKNGEIYDITGRRVKAITAPGIYIVNGKKVIK